MDFNLPYGPQKNEILKELDPLNVKRHKKIHLKRLRNGRVMVVMEFNPIKVINPTQSWGEKIIRP